jgi:hypothetical protein
MIVPEKYTDFRASATLEYLTQYFLSKKTPLRIDLMSALLMEAQWVGLVNVGLIDVGLVNVGVIDVGLANVGLIDAGVINVGVINAGLVNTVT